MRVYRHRECIQPQNKPVEREVNGLTLGLHVCMCVQAVFRKGKALSMKGDHDEADEYLAAAADLDDTLAADVEAARAANKQRAKAAATKQKQQFRNFFSKA